jgi:2-oxoglutarate dehydrogenase complex dehydrogenase (E1) component-like enzyme
MGAWTHVRDRLPWRDCSSRRAAASPATGFQLLHRAEQEELVAHALGRG